MSVKSQVQKMIQDLTVLEEDIDRHEKGQKAAGTRIRKAMQTVKTQAQEVRGTVMEDQKKPRN